MGRIQSSVGIITGIPITDTVDKLMSISARPRDLVVSRNKLLQSEQTAIAELTASVLAVQFAGKSLASASIFNKKNASTSNSAALGVAVTGNPAAGNYQFTPLQQAQAQQLLSQGFASKTTALGEGSLTVSRGGFVDPAIELAQLNGGAGVARGKIRITDRSGASAEIDLRYAVTIDDVLAKINAADNIDVIAAADGDAIRLTDQTGQTTSNLRVAEVGSGTTAADLGLASINAAADFAVGSDVLSLASGTLISRLRDGNGLSLRQGVADLTISFRDGSADLSIDFNDLAALENRDGATLGDLLAVLNSADPARLSAAIGPDGDRIVLTDLTTDNGDTFSVASAFGGSVAEELGVATTAADDEIAGGRLLAGLKDTLLSSLGGGAGLGLLGDLELTDRSGASATVNLASAETLGDVISAINAAGIGIRAEVNKSAGGIVLRDTSGGSGNLIVASGDATNSADKLQLAVSAAQGSIDSGSLHRQFISRQTKLADYNGGQGVTAGKFVITDSDGGTAVIDATLEGITKIGDVLDLINSAGIGVEAGINASGDGIRLIDTAGGSGTLRVTNGSKDTATDLLILGEAETVDIGGTPTQVIDGSTAVTIEITDTDTLEDLVEKINDSGLPLAANLFSDGSGATPFRLSLTASESGNAGRLLIDTSDAGFTLDEIVAAQDSRLLFGSITAGGIVAVSSDNMFDDLIEGLSLTVGEPTATPVTVSVTSTDASIVSSVKTLIDQFNKLRDKVNTHTFFNAEENTTGILFGSNETLRIESELNRLFSGRLFGLGDVQSLAELGIGFKDDGKLELDQEKLEAKIAADPQAVEQFFTDEERGFAKKLDAATEALVGAENSLLINRSAALSIKIDFNVMRIETMTGALDRQREKLLAEYYNLEAVIAKLQESLTTVQSLSILAPL